MVPLCRPLWVGHASITPMLAGGAFPMTHSTATPRCTRNRVWGFVMMGRICAVSADKKRRTPDGGTQARGKCRDWPSGNILRRSGAACMCLYAWAVVARPGSLPVGMWAPRAGHAPPWPTLG